MYTLKTGYFRLINFVSFFFFLFSLIFSDFPQENDIINDIVEEKFEQKISKSQ